MARRAGKSTFGNIRQLSSKRWQARYTGPDGKTYSARTPQDRPLTFETMGDADAYLAAQRVAISRGTWEPPGKVKAAAMTLRPYADAWLAERELKIRTREHYRRVLDKHILPAFGDHELTAIEAAAVRTWHARDAGPTIRAHSYSLLRSIMGTAVTDGAIASNPCHIRGAGKAKTAKQIRAATLDELATLTAALPPRYRMLAQLAAWCSLRFGECAGLQRADVDLRAAVLHVRRGIVYTEGGLLVQTPKSGQVRTVTLPSHILPGLRAHIAEHAEPGKAGYVFPAAGGGPLAASTLEKVFTPAAAKAGRPDLTPHGLRHTGQTMAAVNGANLRELMARAGQVTPDAALRYLHEVDGRQREIAERLSEYAAGGSNVTPIRSRRAGAVNPAEDGTG